MEENRSATDIFLSYAHGDRGRAEKLVGLLEKEGWTVWWDEHLIGGTRFDRAIGDALDAARCVIVLWSPNSVKSDFVFDEARRAYQRNVIAPAIIDGGSVPLGFGRIQYVNLDAPDGFDRLREAVRVILMQPPKPPQPQRRWGYWLAGGLAAVLAALTLAWFLKPSYPDRFRTLRSGAGAPAETQEAMLGLTIWRLRRSASTDPPHTRMLQEPAAGSGSREEWTPVRVRAGVELPEGSRVRLGVESSRDGFAYVIDRELHADGTTGAPQLVFPTARTRGGVDRVVHGQLLQLPSLDAAVQYWDLRRRQPDYVGELLTVIVSPQKLPELDDGAVSPARLAQWERDWTGGVHSVFNGPEGELLSASEAQARTDPGRLLTPKDALPSAIYAGQSRGSTPLLVNYQLRVSRSE